MKNKRLNASTRFLIISIAAIVLTMAFIGISNIFAEPTINDLVETKDIGSFKPERLYKDGDEFKLVDWMNNTHLIFEYDMWKDTDNNGIVDQEDVYSVDGFEHHMIMSEMLYPVFELSEDDSFYIIPMLDFKSYNGVITELAIGNNNEFAQMKDENTYFYDSSEKILYIDKALVKASTSAESFATLKTETIMLVKDINELTRRTQVLTLFSSDIENTHGLLKNTPNGYFDFNYKDWSSGALTYQLVPHDKLAHVSADDLQVYLNHTETVGWKYDETTGKITINSTPQNVEVVTVKFNNVHEADELAAKLQASNKEKTAQAASLTEIDMGNNPFLKKLTFEHDKPVVGASQKMEFAAFAIDKNGTFIYSNLFGSVDSTNISNAVNEFVKNADKKVKYYKTTTLSALQTNPKNEIAQQYGDCVYNVGLGTESAIQNAIEWASTALKDIDKGDRWWTGTFTNNWRQDYWVNGEITNYVGRYITGVNAATEESPFLGGIVTDGDGYAFFDTTCAQIKAVNTHMWNAHNNAHGGSGSGTDFRSKASIVEIDEEKGMLYICIWARGLDNPNNTEDHTQRMLAFSKVPYEYNGKGTFTLSKVDTITKENLSGAKYSLYNNPDCNGTPVIESIVTTSTPIQSEEIEAGTYYLKEIAPPTGYTLNNSVFKVEIKGGKDTKVVVENRKQQVTLDFTVYDRTTEGRGQEMPVPGLSFILKNPDGSEYGRYTTNSNGQLTNENGSSIVIDAIGNYSLEQIGTVKDYAYDTKDYGDHRNHKYQCHQIVVDANPRAEGESHFGKDFTTTLKHYEQRQTVSIKSHVQDSKVGDKSKSILGGISYEETNMNNKKDSVGSYTSLIGARYELYARSDLFLGYSYATGRPQKVIVPKDTKLTFVARSKNNTEVHAKETWSQAIDASVDKSFVQVDTIVYNGEEYPAPNGIYEWSLVVPSPGYYLETSQNSTSEANKLSKTQIDASWALRDDTTRDYIVHKNIKDVPVKQVRQRIEFEIYVKSASISAGSTTTNIRPIIPGYKNPPSLFAGTHTIHPSGSKVIEGSNNSMPLPGVSSLPNGPMTVDRVLSSDSTSLSALSVDYIDIIKTSKVNGQKQTVSAKSNGTLPHTVVKIKTLVPTIDIDSGSTVDSGMTVGYYLSTTDGVEGLVKTNKWSSTGFKNPNKETSLQMIPNYMALSTDKTKLTGSLPNGQYAISILIAQDGYTEELVFSDDISFGLSWSQETANKPVLKYTTTLMLNDSKTIDNPEKLIVSPDPEHTPNDPNNPQPDYPYTDDKPYNPTDPYDPENPDDPENNPDDSDDIPLVTMDWVNKNSGNYAYRVTDADNITIVDGVEYKDVQDTLPTTFSFYFPSKSELNKDKYTYTYETWYYYEISKDEYNQHVNSCEYNNVECTRPDHIIMNNGSTTCKSHHDSLCGLYVKFNDNGGTHYYRRFNSPAASGGDAQTSVNLTDVIAWNKNSLGYENPSMLKKENATVSASIYNYDWLNEKLSNKPDGEYRIGVRVNIIENYVVDNMPIERRMESYGFGSLTIKNRQLFPLD